MQIRRGIKCKMGEADVCWESRHRNNAPFAPQSPAWETGMALAKVDTIGTLVGAAILVKPERQRFRAPLPTVAEQLIAELLPARLIPLGEIAGKGGTCDSTRCELRDRRVEYEWA